MDKKEFEFKLTYFKPSGKYYTDVTFRREVRCIGATAYMHDAAAHVRGLRDSGGQGAMYGLSEATEGWDGFILLECADGYPCLIIPEVTR